MLTNYGFLLKENVYNYARITIPLGEFLSPDQASSLTKGYSLDLPVVFKLKYSEFSMELLKAFRGFSWDANANSSYAFFHPNDYDLELLSIDKMIQALEKIYSAYPTTIEQDEVLLNQSNSRLYFAVKSS